MKYSCQFPEMELVTEAENYLPEKNSKEKTDEEKMKEYSDFLKSKNMTGSLGEVSESELQKIASQENDNDKQLRKFKERVSHEPEQVNPDQESFKSF